MLPIIYLSIIQQQNKQVVSFSLKEDTDVHSHIPERVLA